jgi:hypothetical protein
VIKILSYGGGLDSFAMLLGGIQRGDVPDYAVFADVGSPAGDDGEWPSTYRHIEDVARPLAKKHGVEFVWLTTEEYPIRGSESLLAYFEKKSILPTRMSRLCTSAAKVERITDWIQKELSGQKMEVWIGFEAGEENRAAKDPHASKTCGDEDYRKNRFPLMEWGLCRCRCEVMTRQAGYPVPRKSACMFCPFSRRGDFIKLAQEQPGIFMRFADWEARSGTTKAGQKLWIMQDKALPEAIEKPYKPREIKCLVCGRDPRASKATGSDYLQPDEYVPEEDPKGWKPQARRNPIRPVTIPIDHTEAAIAAWLSGRLLDPVAGLAVAAGGELTLDAGDAPRAIELLNYYTTLSIVDSDLQEPGAGGYGSSRSLARKIVEAAR